MAIEMTPVEISRRLALAIGYATEDVRLQEYRDSKVEVRRYCSGWWVFDYQDVEVIYPIAEHFKMFPQWVCNEWRCDVQRDRVISDCPRTCVALAVIEASERGLL